MIPPTVEWADLTEGPVVRMIDQTLLPNELRILDCSTIPQVCEAIRSLRVRGAPAIGCTAALGLALCAWRSTAPDITTLKAEMATARQELAATRPTAVNLFWALERAFNAANMAQSRSEYRKLILDEALAITVDDLERCKKIGQHGGILIPAGANVLTHCNAGALATAGYGTALGVIRGAFERTQNLHVWVDETRPLLQGARLTAWELMQDAIPCTVICDNMAASLMRAGKIDCCVVGADRIAANGDAANKIGTYGVAVLAHHHNIPFYVAAPLSTVDYELPDGSQIPIEQRNPAEVSQLAYLAKQPATPQDAQIYNPAFDVTPAELISGIITEVGVARIPFTDTLASWRNSQ